MSIYELESQLNFENIDLYARQDELETLKQAYERTTRDKSSSQIVWLSGYAGTGKSSLVQHAYARGGTTEKNYCCARFDYVRNALPFAELVRMVQELCAVIVKNQSSNSCPALIRMQDDEANALIRLVPQLKPLLLMEGDDEDLDESYRRLEWAYEKLKLAFRSLIKGVSATLSSPLVMFFDDLQWADSDSLGIFESLIEDDDMKNVLFVASYRDNNEQVEPTTTTTSPLACCIETQTKRRANDTTTTTIQVENLTQETLDELLADLLDMHATKVATLSELLFSKTQGNPFYALRILKHIHAKELMYFSTNSLCWEWKTEQIRLEIDLSDNVVDFMTQKLLQLPEPTANALKVASCMGMIVDVELLKSILKLMWDDDYQHQSLTTTSVEETLQVAVDEQLINMNADTTRFKFAHEKIQAAAYNTIDSEHARQKLHLQIGQYLQKTIIEDDAASTDGDANNNDDDDDDTENDWKFILAVDQINRGEGLIKNDEDRVKLAEYNLDAAEKVMATSAFELAASFLERGQTALGANCWDDQYSLTLKVISTLASVHFSNGSMAPCLTLVEEIYAASRCREDKYLAQSLHVQVLACSNRLTECIEVCLGVLRDLGHPKLPKKAGLIHIIPGIIGVERKLKGKTDADILNLPICTDQTALATMDILCVLSCVFYFAGQDKFLPVITCRMIHLSLKYGVNRWTPFALAGYGISMTATNNFAAAKRFGKLALDMMKLVRVNDPRTMVLVHGLLEHVQKPLSHSINTTLQVYDVAFSQGDLRYMGQAAFIHCFVRYVAGVRLQLLAKDAVSFATQLKKYNQVLMWKHVVIIHWATLKLIEQPSDLVKSTGTLVNGNQLEGWLLGASTNSQDMILFHFWSFAMASHVHCGEFEAALSLAEKCWSSNEPEVALPFMIQHFGMNALVAIDQWQKTRKPRYWKQFRKFRNQLKAWAKKGNLNGLHLITLMEAEAAAVKKSSIPADVRKLYDSSIASACRSGFIHDAALASARCCKYFLQDANKDLYWATHFMSRARELYVQWGAVAAVRNLDVRYGDLIDEDCKRRSTKSSSLSVSTHGTSVKGRSRQVEIQRAEGKRKTPMLRLEGASTAFTTTSSTAASSR